MLNFYELVAISYNEEFLDRVSANKNLAYTVVVNMGVRGGLRRIPAGQRSSIFR